MVTPLPVPPHHNERDGLFQRQRRRCRHVPNTGDLGHVTQRQGVSKRLDRHGSRRIGKQQRTGSRGHLIPSRRRREHQGVGRRGRDRRRANHDPYGLLAERQQLARRAGLARHQGGRGRILEPDDVGDCSGNRIIAVVGLRQQVAGRGVNRPDAGGLILERGQDVETRHRRLMHHMRSDRRLVGKHQLRLGGHIMDRGPDIAGGQIGQAQGVRPPARQDDVPAGRVRNRQGIDDMLASSRRWPWSASASSMNVTWHRLTFTDCPRLRLSAALQSFGRVREPTDVSCTLRLSMARLRLVPLHRLLSARFKAS